MADFDSDWKITGSPDPATPDPQPHQTAQTVTAPQTVPAPQTVQNVQPAQVVPAAMPQAQAMPYPRPVTVPASVYTGAYQQQVPNVQASGYQRTATGFVPSPGQIVQNTELIAERDANIVEINKMINHFSPKLNVYQDYEKCISDIDKYSQTSVAPFVWGILFGLHSLIFVYSAATSNYKDNILVFALIALGFLLVGAALITVFFVKKKKHKAKLEELFVKFEDLSNQLKIIYNGYSSCVLPPEYTDPRILNKIQSLLYSGRFFSIGNSLNSMLAFPGVYQRIVNAKEKFTADTSARFNGTPAFFNAVRYLIPR